MKKYLIMLVGLFITLPLISCDFNNDVEITAYNVRDYFDIDFDYDVRDFSWSSFSYNTLHVTIEITAVLDDVEFDGVYIGGEFSTSYDSKDISGDFYIRINAAGNGTGYIEIKEFDNGSQLEINLLDSLSSVSYRITSGKGTMSYR